MEINNRKTPKLRTYIMFKDILVLKALRRKYEPLWRKTRLTVHFDMYSESCMCNMLCNVIHDINIQLSLNYVSRGKHTQPQYRGHTSGPDLRLITCTSLINKLYLFRTRVFIHFITVWM